MLKKISIYNYIFISTIVLTFKSKLVYFIKHILGKKT